ncbi:assimilatory sulfite reductase [Hysterangium stoloniferum]|nr:assimilatory sulfite reductase [Hysterangium stoloniferum]
MSQASTLLEKFKKNDVVDVAASSVIESISSQSSNIVFLYNLAVESGFGALTKEWSTLDQNSARVILLQTRIGAGLTLVGRLSEGTSQDGHRSLPLTAYTSPSGLAQMAPALDILPKPTSSRRLVIQVASITSVGPDLLLSPTLGPLSVSLFSLPETFTVLLSSTPQESIDLATVAYRLPNSHVVHIFDYHGSAREITRVQFSPVASSTNSSVQEALAQLKYSFFDYAGDKDAHTVLVMLNSPLANIANAFGHRIPGFGVLVVRVLRPWDEKALRHALPKTVRNIHVMEDVPTETVRGGLFNDVFSTLFDPNSPDVTTFQTHRNIPAKTQKYFSTPDAFPSFISSLLLPSALPLVPFKPITSPASKKLLFLSAVDSSTASLPALISKMFLSHRSIKTRHLSAFDAYSKVGGVSADRIILSAESDGNGDIPVSFLLPLDPAVPEDTEGTADFVGILEPALLKTHSILKYARPNAPILVCTNWTSAELISNVAPQALEHIRSRSLKVYTLDVKGVAAQLLPNAQSSNKDVLEAVIGYIAFMRLYIGGGSASIKSVEQLARSAFGSFVEGIDIGVVCAKAWDALIFLLLPSSEGDSIEAKAVSLNEFGFNTVEPIGCESLVDVTIPKVSTWHDAAKHIIFREAFAPPPPTPSSDESETHVQTAALRPDVPERTFLVTTTVNRRLTPKEYDRNVFHLEFNTQGTGLKYAIGEALGVHGWNDTDEISDFCRWYGVDPNQLIILPAPGREVGGTKLMHTRTIFQALQQQVDIFGKPPKSFYAALSKYAQKRTEKMALYFISSPEGSSTFKKLSEKDTVSFVDVLRLYPSARPPIAELCDLVGDISPRHYSIASSQAAVGDRVDLLVVTVDWVTPSGAPRYGQCTRYLANLKVGQRVTVSIKPSVMKLPPNPLQPIIMAGLGTGAAPFRAFMQHRAWLASQNIPVGPLLYYFGSRHRSQEYLYGEEIEAFIADNVITHCGLAFSRDGKKKVYIQHKMLEDAEMLVKHLSGENGVFYLCGPTWPVPDVYKALVDALVKYVGKTEEEAGEYLESLKEEERYVLEVY